MFLIHFLITIFLVGLAGSAIVVTLSFVEDFREIFGDDDDLAGTHLVDKLDNNTTIPNFFRAPTAGLHDHRTR
ncbi:MAG TPA: hypothetical protein VFJ52_08120 [Terriglobia bacterium]|nr:hypothetical protein [Terriglobia bacterium]